MKPKVNQCINSAMSDRALSVCAVTTPSGKELIVVKIAPLNPEGTPVKAAAKSISFSPEQSSEVRHSIQSVASWVKQKQETERQAKPAFTKPPEPEPEEGEEE